VVACCDELVLDATAAMKIGICAQEHGLDDKNKKQMKQIIAPRASQLIHTFAF